MVAHRLQNATASRAPGSCSRPRAAIAASRRSVTACQSISISSGSNMAGKDSGRGKRCKRPAPTVARWGTGNPAPFARGAIPGTGGYRT